MLQSVYEAKATIAHVMSWFSYQFLMQYATFGLFVNLPVLYEIKRACLEHLLLCLIQLNHSVNHFFQKKNKNKQLTIKYTYSAFQHSFRLFL